MFSTIECIESVITTARNRCNVYCNINVAIVSAVYFNNSGGKVHVLQLSL